MPLASYPRFSFDRTDGICAREELDESQIMSSFSKLQAPAALSGNLPSSNFEFNQEFSKLLLDYIYILLWCAKGERLVRTMNHYLFPRVASFYDPGVIGKFRTHLSVARGDK